ncbi:Fungalysin metallopeptidase-domain-containing protein, partial [Globomyces pollinis-pini]
SEYESTQLGIEALKKEYQLSPSDYVVTQSYKDTSGIVHIYGLQTVDQIRVDNSHFSIHVLNDKVISVTSTFKGSQLVKRNAVVKRDISITAEEAVKIAVDKYGIPIHGSIKTAYIQLPNGSLAFAYQFQLKSTTDGSWVQVSIDASTGQVLQLVDFVNKSAFRSLLMPKTNPKSSFTLNRNPEDLTTSINGWNNDGIKYTTTRGNNVVSLYNNNLLKQSGPDLTFDYYFDPLKSATDIGNLKAAMVNSFYVANYVHDISYQYGFTEAAGNFQQNNFGKGGNANDPVQILNLANGKNNAQFATPPDGQPGVMSMFEFDVTTPTRNGAFENTIVIHEYVHGITNRMTGGSRQANCLQTLESGGMGEGWSDTVAMFLSRTSRDTRSTDFVLGDYVLNNLLGVREKAYSTNMNINPLTYASLNNMNQVHRIGTVWATMLNEVYWNIVEAFGFSAKWSDATQRIGNIMILQNVITGLSLQPCNPTFLTARDAILKADELNYNSKNKCLIWQGFAKRGLGVNAKKTFSWTFEENYEIPDECK